MENIFKVNGNMLFSQKHMVFTENGLVEVQNLKENDVIIGIKGVGKVIKSIECVARPNAPILDNN